MSERQTRQGCHAANLPPSFSTAGGTTCSSSTPLSELDDCVSGSVVEDFGLPYDFDSIMHYFPDA